MVQPRVVRAGGDHQVGRTIVQGVTVAVMDDFAGVEGPAEAKLHDQAMDEYALAGDGHRRIAIGTNTAVTPGAAAAARRPGRRTRF